MSFWKAEVSFPSNFASIFSTIKHNTYIHFYLKHYSLCSKEDHSSEIFRSKFVKFLMSILKQHVNSSSNFASFFIVMTHNSCVNFKLIRFLLWIKVFYKSPNFGTFECFSKNMSNPSCHIPNHK